MRSELPGLFVEHGMQSEEVRKEESVIFRDLSNHCPALSGKRTAEFRRAGSCEFPDPGPALLDRKVQTGIPQKTSLRNLSERVQLNSAISS